jgi:hypothetical protein
LFVGKIVGELANELGVHQSSVGWQLDAPGLSRLCNLEQRPFDERN